LLFPLGIAFLQLFIRTEKARNVTVLSSCALLAVASLTLLFRKLNIDIHFYQVENTLIDQGIFAVEVLLSLFLIYISAKHKKYWVTLLVVLQSALMIWFELAHGHSIHTANNFFVDRLSIIMSLIIGIIGSLVVVYALGYMKDFQVHNTGKIADKRPFFFFILFAFMSAMYGVVFSNNLLWLYFFWEVTTVCSFLLIGYKNDQESINNAFLALFMNLIGGLCFAAGIVYLYLTSGVIELDKMLALTQGAVVIPVILLAVAGLTKSAQLPFSKWLLGAMVAPTPVSALLHSSTMVKAGVYLLLKLAPLMTGTNTGLLVALIGGFTFLITSFIAISQSDAKKVLAYSTIANLGLIVLCAGIGTYEALWAGILLIIFHAIAKGLLFICVGTVEHKISSRSIEAMDELVMRMPKLSSMMFVGMAGMFLAPFGMLISKWAVLKAILDADPILSVLVIFGSSASLFFWVKWMGKLITVVQDREDIEQGISKTEWFPLYALSGLTIAACLFFPAASRYLIEPYSMHIYGMASTMNSGNLTIMMMMLGLVILFPFVLPGAKYDKHVKLVDAYLGGANLEGSASFRGSLGGRKQVVFANYYLEKYFVETKTYRIGFVICTALLFAMFLGMI
jgi:ech hydrogenase subunit A